MYLYKNFIYYNTIPEIISYAIPDTKPSTMRYFCRLDSARFASSHQDKAEWPSKSDASQHQYNYALIPEGKLMNQ